MNRNVSFATAPLTPVVKWLIIINVVVFVLQLLTRSPRSNGVTGWFELSGDAVLRHWEVWRLLTSAFCHSPAQITHLLFNMLGLWIFGNLVEGVYGAREFLRFYLTAAVVSAVGFLVVELLVTRFAIRQIPAEYGASGAVMAVMMVFLALITMTGSVGLSFLMRGMTSKAFSSGSTTSVMTASPWPSVTQRQRAPAVAVERTA